MTDNVHEDPLGLHPCLRVSWDFIDMFLMILFGNACKAAAPAREAVGWIMVTVLFMCAGLALSMLYVVQLCSDNPDATRDHVIYGMIYDAIQIAAYGYVATELTDIEVPHWIALLNYLSTLVDMIILKGLTFVKTFLEKSTYLNVNQQQNADEENVNDTQVPAAASEAVAPTVDSINKLATLVNTPVSVVLDLSDADLEELLLQQKCIGVLQRPRIRADFKDKAAKKQQVMSALQEGRLHRAVEYNNTELISEMFEKATAAGLLAHVLSFATKCATEDRELKKKELTLLHIAAYKGHTQATAKVLEAATAAGCLREALDAKDVYGATPLHWAAANGNLEATAKIVEAAKAAGCLRQALDAKRDGGETPLHMAAFRGTPEAMAKMLEAAKAAGCLRQALEAKTNGGDTPLHAAAESDNPEVMAKIVEAAKAAGCLRQALDAKDAGGDTPLHMAARSRNPEAPEVARVLLANGANASIRNNEGKRPADLVWGDSTLKRLLQ